MMNFNVGYQLREDDRFLETLVRYKDRVSEVYFSRGSMPNGRHSALRHAVYAPWEAAAKTDGELAYLASEGFQFNLLLNGACYGGESLSKKFFTEVLNTVDEVGEKFGLTSVTTTSPNLAHLVKVNFPDLEIRASVNMGVGTKNAVDFLSEDFDGFYLARELNRDLPALQALSDYVRSLGKKRYILLNSGCLNYCPARSYHDNLVAHEEEIASRDNAVVFRGLCADALSKPENQKRVLSLLNLVRPEDLALYEGLADGYKLATRVSPSPETILSAYAEGHYSGNLLDLTEPDHAGHFYPVVIENSRLPEGFGKQVSHCSKNCASCGYCVRAYEEAAVKLNDLFTDENRC